MNSRTLDLFATPKEQYYWLLNTLTHKDVWCLIERPRNNYQALVAPHNITMDMLGNEFSRARIFIGRTDYIGRPVWRPDTLPRELDVAASLAILFEPATPSKNELLSGRLTILHGRQYEARNINDKRLLTWYRKLARSLKKTLGKRETKLLVVEPGKPKTPVLGNHIVSVGAEVISMAGMALKQFQESEVTFELDEQRPAKAR